MARCGWHEQALRGAVAIYDDRLDLLEHDDSSPLGVRQRRHFESQPCIRATASRRLSQP